MDRLDIDVQVVHPSFCLSTMTEDPELEAALMRSYNTFMADKCGRSNGRLVFNAVVPFRSPGAAVEEIRRLMFVFEDILLVNDRGIQSVLKEIDNSELILALRTASEELKDKIFQNMSDRAVQLIKEEMEYMGPVRLGDVGAAQQRIGDVVRRLEDAGEIIIAGRGDKDIIV